jgi:hypothetical protein
MKILKICILSIILFVNTNFTYSRTKKTHVRITAPNSTVAHLSNYLLDLYFREQNCDTWSYQYEPGNWGESCFREHFGVWTSDWDSTAASEYFTIDVPFTDPGGGSGSIEATLHFTDIQVKRRISLPRDNIRFFQIQYTIKNTGQSTIKDVRFFETIDFDVPTTDDCLDDYGWYDETTDYIGVKDDRFFRNGMASNIRSTRHSLQYYSVVLNDDWDDGELNNNNYNGPGDPGIGKQFNLGDFSPGKTDIIILTIWFGNPTEANEPDIESGMYYTSNKLRHHTSSYPDEYWIFRRANSIYGRLKITGDFDASMHNFRFKLTKPDETHLNNIPDISTFDQSSGNEWGVSFSDILFYDYMDFKIRIPKDAQIGNYKLTAELFRNDASGTQVISTILLPDFFVIFNPWNEDQDPVIYDDDVYNPLFSDHELDYYVLSSIDYNFYDECDIHDGSDGAKCYINDKYTGRQVKWILKPQSKTIFDYSIEAVKGILSGEHAARVLTDRANFNTNHNNWNLIQKGCFSSSSDKDILHGISVDSIAELTALSFLKKDWRNAPRIITDYYNEPDTHPTGQCMDFSGLLCALMKSIGIPSRMTTGINTCNWNWHCWNEIRVNDTYLFQYDLEDNNWRAVDAVFQSNVMDRNYGDEYSSLFQYITGHHTTAIYTIDASSPILFPESRIDVQDAYQPVPGSMDFTNIQNDDDKITNKSTNISISVNENYVIGDSINVIVELTNISDQIQNDNLLISIYNSELNPEVLITTFNIPNIQLAKDSSVTRTFILSMEQYRYNGKCRISAQYGQTSAIEHFYIDDAYHIEISGRSSVFRGESYDISLRITNTLSVPVNDIEVWIYFPSESDVHENPQNLTISNLNPDETYNKTWTISTERAGPDDIFVIVYSDRGGYEKKYFEINVIENASITGYIKCPEQVTIDSVFTVDCMVKNIGNETAQNVELFLLLPTQMTTNHSSVFNVDNIKANCDTTLNWEITASQSGSYPVSLKITADDCETIFSTDIIKVRSSSQQLALQTDVTSISNVQQQTIVLTIINSAGLQDSIRIQSHTNSSMISYTIYDNSIPIISGPLVIPPKSVHILTMRVTPMPGSSGTITVTIQSLHDPGATASVKIYIGEKMQVPVETGWNFISFPLRPVYSDIDSIITPVRDNLKSVWHFERTISNQGVWRRFDPEGPEFLNDLIKVQADNAYWFEMNESDTLILDGVLNDIPIPVYTGWNMVGYNSITSMSVENALMTIDSLYYSMWSFDQETDSWLQYASEGSEQLNTLSMLYPYSGYWIKAKQNCTWDISNSSVITKSISIQDKTTISSSKDLPPILPFTIYGSIPESLINPTAENHFVSLIIDGREIVSCEIQTNLQYQNHFVLKIPILTDSNINESGASEGQRGILLIDGKNFSNNNIIIGKSGETTQFEFPQAIKHSETMPDRFDLGQNYPNPFNPCTIIEYQLPKASTVSIKIYNILGKLVKELINRNIQAGYHKIDWDGTDQNGRFAAQGIYFYIMKVSGGFRDSKKMILLK